MTDKVQKIRNEVERLQNELIQEKEKGFGSDTDDACILELQNILTYIDSLQEEPAPKIFEDMLNAVTPAESLGISAEEHDKIVDECLYGKEPELVDVDDLPNKEEEPVSEDLEAELDKYIQDNFTIDKEQLDRFGIEEKDYMYSMDKSDMEKMVRYFTGNHKIPVSDDLEEAAKLYVSDSLCITSEEDWDDAAIEALNAYKAGAQWQKEKEYTCYEEAFEDGAKWKGEHLWKPADGDDLPEIDREVIVLIKYNAQRNIHDEEYPTYRVGFGHRPNPNGWDGKNIDTNKVTHYIPKLYDKGGWNAPNIVYWLDVELPKELNYEQTKKL